MSTCLILYQGNIMAQEIKTNEQIAYDQISEFIKAELGEYSFVYTITLDDLDDEEVIYNVKYGFEEPEHLVTLKYNLKEEKLYVQMHDDYW